MIENDRLYTAERLEGEAPQNNPLRPTRLDEYIGQADVKKQMSVFIRAALARGESLDHTLIYGPPGLGKTTLAHIVAGELGTQVVLAAGPNLTRTGDLATLLTSLKPGQLLFIDEIHRLNTAVEEVLYSAMEDFRLDIILGEGPAARSIALPLPNFTLIGATTRTGLMSKPLFDRFGIVQHLDFYEPESLSQIVQRSAAIKQIGITPEAALEIATRARGTPRIANRLLMRVRDFASLEDNPTITQELAAKAVSEMKVDPLGLNKLDHLLLSLIVDQFGGGPVGVGSLAVAMQESKDTLEDMIEPYLIRSGYLQRTAKGRIATALTYQLLQKELPVKPDLFSSNPSYD